MDNSKWKKPGNHLGKYCSHRHLRELKFCLTPGRLLLPQYFSGNLCKRASALVNQLVHLLTNGRNQLSNVVKSALRARE